MLLQIGLPDEFVARIQKSDQEIKRRNRRRLGNRENDGSVRNVCALISSQVNEKMKQDTFAWPTYGDLFRALLETEKTLVMGIYRRHHDAETLRYSVVNPPSSLRLHSDDRIFVLAGK